MSPVSPAARARRVSFSDVLSFQSPPLYRRHSSSLPTIAKSHSRPKCRRHHRHRPESSHPHRPRHHHLTPDPAYKENLLPNLSHTPLKNSTIRSHRLRSPLQPTPSSHNRPLDPTPRLPSSASASSAPSTTFFPSLSPSILPTSSPHPSPLLRVAFIKENGAKAHMHRFVLSRLHLPAEHCSPAMMHALDAAQVHVLYALSRRTPCTLAVLRRAESEERELARLHAAARRELRKYAVARVVADERRARRVARLALRRFLESEGGLWTEADGVQMAVVALGRRIQRFAGL